MVISKRNIIFAEKIYIKKLILKKKLINVSQNNYATVQIMYLKILCSNFKSISSVVSEISFRLSRKIQFRKKTQKNVSVRLYAHRVRTCRTVRFIARSYPTVLPRNTYNSVNCLNINNEYDLNCSQNFEVNKYSKKRCFKISRMVCSLNVIKIASLTLFNIKLYVPFIVVIIQFYIKFSFRGDHKQKRKCYNLDRLLAKAWA